jgi:Rrf2 family protein
LEYGLAAAGYVATHQNDGNILAETIAEKYGIPVTFLLRILQQLVRAGILVSKRGPHGGYVMGRPPENVSILDIIQAIDGRAASGLYLSQQTSNALFAQKIEKICETAAQHRNDILRSATLAEMIK